MVGIITLNSAKQHNFGCLLQNYALKHYLNKEDIPAESVYCGSFSFLGACNGAFYRNLNLDFRKEERRLYPVNRAERKKNRVCADFVKEKIRPVYYWQFNDRVHRDIAEKYSKVIVGSDQVWNPHWAVHDKSAATYLLTFLPPEKRVSYAASFGTSELPESQKDRYRDALQHFHAISVREEAGKHIVEGLTGRTDVQVLVDPTMLLTANEWDEIACKPKAPVPQKYILTYFLGEVSLVRKAAIEAKARQMDCEVIALMDKNSPFYAVGPDQFIYLVKHAACVCTDSFHGSVFSFLYQRPLAIFGRVGEGENMHSRLETFTAKFSLQDCLVTEDSLSCVPETVDYAAGYATLELERLKAKAFLDMVFEEAERAGLCN